MNQEEIKKALVDYFGISGDNRRFFDATQIPRICNDISGIRKAIEDMKEKIDGRYVTKEEYAIVRHIVFGACALILVAVFSALVYLVVKGV